MAEQQWLTYNELAERFGISSDWARMLAKRRGWPKKSANYPRGPIRIGIPDEGPSTERTIPQGDNANIPELANGYSPLKPSVVHHQVEAMVPLTKVLSLIAEAVAQERAQQDRLQGDHARYLTQRDNLYLDLISRLQNQAAVERGIFIERVDAAELRAEAAEARAAAVDEKLHQVLDRLLGRQSTAPEPAPPTNQTWWERCFGLTKRSNVGR